MKKLFIYLCCLLFIFSCNVAWAATGQNQNKIQELWAKADKLRENGDFEQAIKLYTKAISLKPNSAEAYFRRGGCYSSWFYSDNNNVMFGGNTVTVKYIQSALDDYTKAIELNPSNLEYYFSRASLYKDDEKKLNDYRKMVELTTAKIVKSPDITSYYYKRIAEMDIESIIQLAEMKKYSSKDYSYSPEDSKRMEMERLEQFRNQEIKRRKKLQEDEIILSLKPRSIEEELLKYQILSDVYSDDGYFMYDGSIAKYIEENNQIKIVKVGQEELEARRERQENIIKTGINLLERKELDAGQKMIILDRIAFILSENESVVDKERILEYCEQVMELAEKEGGIEEYSKYIRDIENKIR